MDLVEYKNKYGMVGMYGVMAVKTLIRPIKKAYQLIYCRYTPVDEKAIVFKSMPDYTDNARIMSDWLVDHGYGKEYKIYWAVTDVDKCKALYPDARVEFVQFEDVLKEKSFKAINVFYKAKWNFGTHGTTLNRITGRKEQKFIWLWHGCSFKDATGRDGTNAQPKFDYACVAGELFIPTKSKFWNVGEERIVAKGYPRYNWLKEKNVRAQTLLDGFKNDATDKVIMWMPTFRNDKNGKYNESNNISQFPLIATDGQWLALDKACKEAGVVIVLKLHPYQKDYPIPFAQMNNVKEVTNADFEKSNIPMYSFVALTDALITDYSSIAIDYLIVDKPLGFTLDDFEAYRSTRGFVFDDPREYMPGEHMYVFDGLLDFVKSVAAGEDKYKAERKKVQEVAVCKSDDYCADVLKAVGFPL